MSIHRLKGAALPALVKTPGKHADGAGLYLQVAKSGSGASWVYQFSLKGRVRWMCIGPAATFTLAEAREAHHEARRLRDRGVDPLEARRAAAPPAGKTFGEALAMYIGDPAGKLAGRADYAKRWRQSLMNHAADLLPLALADIDTAQIEAVLKPIWTGAATSIGAKVRARIEHILAWAVVKGYRQPGDNPARWSGHLEHVLSGNGKLQGEAPHHAALPYADLPAFVAKLRAVKTSTRAPAVLEFIILTAARTGEALGADWSEIDLAQKLWTVPPARMKAKREHRVPLSDRAIELLGEPRKSGLIFTTSRGKQLAKMILPTLIRKIETAATVHGMRSTFRDWAAEMTDYPGEMVEMALAHAVADKVEAAYRRGDMFAKRIKLMNDWAAFASGA